jgi:hypothetical protein
MPNETPLALRIGPSGHYGIEMCDPELAQALADLIEMGLVVDIGQRSFHNGLGGS